MGLSKYKYLLLLLSLPHTFNFFKLRDLITVDQSMCWSPMSWALSSPKDIQVPVWKCRDREGSLCPDLGRFGYDDKDSLIMGPVHKVPESLSKKCWGSSRMSQHSSQSMSCLNALGKEKLEKYIWALHS